MAIASHDIKKDSTTFYIIKLFGKYFVYETFFGNVVKIYGQAAHGSINRVVPIVKYMRNERKTDKIKLFYLEADLNKGLSQKELPNIFKGKKGNNNEYKETSAKFVKSSVRPTYDLLIREESIYYCIETSDGKFLLYDYDLGNPLTGDIENQQGMKFMVSSGTAKNTKALIDSLPEKSTVYSLKVDFKSGLVKGNEEFERLVSDTAKNQTENISIEKNKDSTAMKVRKDEIRIKKRDKLMNGG